MTPLGRLIFVLPACHKSAAAVSKEAMGTCRNATLWRKDRVLPLQAAGCDETGLIKRLQQGDKLAFEVMVAQYGPRLYTLVHRMLRHPQEAEDLTQEIFLQAYRKLSLFRGECSFYTWIYRIAVNLTLNRLRVNVPQWESIDAADEQVMDTTPGPARHVEESELRTQMEQALAKLDEGNRLVFIMREVQGMAYEDIATVLQCSQDALRARLCRTRRMLQHMLRPYLEGQDPSLHAR